MSDTIPEPLRLVKEPDGRLTWEDPAQSDLLTNSPTWPHVLAFAKRMEAKLAKNRHKGDREGWLKDHPWELVERMLDETVEVQQSFTAHPEGINSPDPEKTADECADVANFCMMVADCVTAAKSANNNPRHDE